MNKNFLSRSTMSLSYNKSQVFLLQNNPKQRYGSINGAFNNTLLNNNNSQIQNINPNKTLINSVNQEQLNSSYNKIVNISRIGNIKNSKSFMNQSISSKNKMKIIEINKAKLLSSGTLISSKKSRKYDKVLKNGKEIQNVDINGDSDNPKNDLDSLSTDSNRIRFKSFDRNKNNSNFSNNTQLNSSYGAENIGNNIQANNNSQLLANNSENQIKLNPFARFINYIFDKINPNINKNSAIYAQYYNRHYINNIPLDSIYNNNINKSTQILNSSNPVELNNALKNETNLKDKSPEIVSDNNSPTINNQNKVIPQTLSMASIKTPNISSIKSQPPSNKPFENESNLNSTDKKTQITKRDDTFTNTKKSESKASSQSFPFQPLKDIITKKSESKTSTQSFPFQPLKDVINSPTSNISINKNINKQNLIYPSDNYIATHLGEYLRNETQTTPFSVEDIINQKKGKGFKCYSQLSQAGRDTDGKLKTNQDTPLVSINVGGIVGLNMFGVLDGHGPDGHFVSIYCKNYFIRNVTQYTNVLKIRKGIYTAEGIYLELKGTKFAFIVGLFTSVDAELASQREFDFILSGTTCNIVFQFNNHLVCFSVGDSRGILINENGQYMEQDILPLSTDHKPDLPGELERIRLCGGEVQSLKDMYGNKLGPSRVFKIGSEYPGLAMSRSLGDLLGKEVGVSPIPQIIEYDININTKYFVICSDGVWEFSSNEQVRDLGKVYYAMNDVVGFCSQLLKLAMNLWEQISNARDDITIVSVFF